MANDFSTDNSCVALYNFESGALGTDSKGSNTLNARNSPAADGTVYKQGSASLKLLSASSQYLQIANASLDSGFPFKNGDTTKLATFTCWVQPSTANQTGYIWGFAASNKHCLHLYQNGTVFSVGFGDGTHDSWWDTVNFPNLTISTGVWYFIAVVVDGINQTIRIYVYNNTTGAWLTNYIRIGANYGIIPGTMDFMVGTSGIYGTTVDSRYFNGYVDELAVFNRCLNFGEIVKIAGGTYTGAASWAGWCVDLVNGVDTQDGTTWSTPIKSLNNRYFGADDVINFAKTAETAAAGTVTTTNGSTTVNTTNDLTSVCPQYTIIRIGGDDMLYMVRSVTASAITLYRPYRGTSASGKNMTYFASLTATTGNTNNPVWMRGTYGHRINIKGGINTSTGDQDGFTIMYGNNGSYALGQYSTNYWMLADMSRFATLYFTYPWNFDWTFGKLTNCFAFRTGSYLTSNKLWIDIEVDGFYHDQSAISALYIYGGKWDKVEVGHASSYHGFAPVNVFNLLLTNYKYCGGGVTNYYAIALADKWKNVRIVNPVVDELNNGLPVAHIGAGTSFVNDVIIENPTVAGGKLLNFYAANAVLVGEMSIVGVNGQNVSRKFLGYGSTGGLCAEVSPDTQLYRTASPSVKVDLKGELYKAISTHRIPCEAGATKTVSLYLRKNTAPLTTVTVGNGGSGYAVGDWVEVTQANAGSSLLRVTAVSSGVVTAVQVYSGGYGYSVANGLATSNIIGSGTGLTINITAIGTGYGGASATADLPIMRTHWFTGTAPNLVANVDDQVMPDTNDDWVQLSKEVTPSVKGAIVVEVIARSSNAGAILWYDDLAVV